MTQFLRLKEVQARTGLSRSSIYRRVAIGTFPKPIPLGSPHAIGFLAEEIEDWAQAQIRAARGALVAAGERVRMSEFVEPGTLLNC